MAEEIEFLGRECDLIAVDRDATSARVDPDRAGLDDVVGGFLRRHVVAAAARDGADPRSYLTTVKEFVSNQQGALEAVVTVQIKWERNAQGQLVPVEVPGTVQRRPAQLALLAMGFLGPEQGLLRDLGLEADPRSNVKADYGRYETSLKGVFAAGDCRRGQSLVVWAINEGRGAAEVCDRYLSSR
jgi:glutamate synthase (NADPH/NADH) small chain